MSQKKILILTSDSGGGHTSAARAIEAGLGMFSDPLSYLVHISRIIEESSSVTRQSILFYNFLLRHYQSYVKYYHWAIHKFNLDRSLYPFYRKYVGQLVDRFCPNVIVSVHPMVQYAVGRMLQDLKLQDRIPLVTVVTDPCGNSWKGWAAHEQAQQEIISYGVSPEKIRICGMPIHPKFQKVDELVPTEMRQELGLDPDRFTVFINAGWIGGGNIPKVFSHLVNTNLKMQAIFLAGKNDKLREEAERIALSARFPVKVLGYSDKMERLMRAADVMVSKIGGLTTFEALACRLPIIMDHITEPMPQESNTADLIASHNAGLRLCQVGDIVPILRNLIENRSDCLAMSDAAHELSIPDATKRVVQELSTILLPKQQVIKTF
ncbi:MAG: UDP-N-acetylglucosamine:LPS N-acetylglucosamine transferase [bacterium]|nr:MAG: UDP-N-acetylglucosamine:LPS N-acetylglucosamine transferase [bacterium]